VPLRLVGGWLAVQPAALRLQVRDLAVDLARHPIERQPQAALVFDLRGELSHQDDVERRFGLRCYS
jgi:hypothetical protein